MSKIPSVTQLATIVVIFFATSIAFGQSAAKDVMVNKELQPGFDMGVNSSKGMTNWLTSERDSQRMSYPAGQTWGAVFITAGPVQDPPRPSMDLSTFNTLNIEMRGGKGNERVGIGVKTNTMPDNGGEKKLTEVLTTDWKVYKIPLDQFNVQLDKLYVVAEFVFSGPEAETIFVRNVSYSSDLK